MNIEAFGEDDTESLCELAELLKVGEQDLDDVVHDCASKIGSAANNGGIPGQIEFLVEQWGVKTTREILEGN